MSITSEEIVALQKKVKGNNFTLQEIMALHRQYGAANYDPLPVAPIYGRGPWVQDITKKWILDLQACYSSVGAGRDNDDYRELQYERMAEGRVAIVPQHVYSPERSVLEKVLVELSGMDKVLLTVDGVGAVEAGLKCARRWAKDVKKIKGDPQIIVADDCFHGRTLAAISASSDPDYIRGFGPPLPGFVNVAFGDADAIKNAITDDTAMVLIESLIQAEGGIKVAPPGYLTEVRRICDENNVLLMYDEVQVGLGRLGYLFGYLVEGEQAKPDLMAIGKFLGGEYTIASALLGRADAIGVFDVGSHGSTFGGNPQACAHATKTLEIITRPGFLEHVRRMGDHFHSFLEDLTGEHIVEFRGQGLLWGIEFTGPIARKICETLILQEDPGIWCFMAHPNVVRFSPPLNIQAEDFVEADAFEKLERVITTAKKWL